MAEDSLISCIVPVFNGERYLGEALDSIMAQSYRPIEIIVIDDGSTDSTANIIGEYGDRVTCIKQANQGPSAARNRGIEAAKGEFIAFLDADDIWANNKLERQMARYEARPELDISMTYIKNFWMPEMSDEEVLLRDTPIAQKQPGPSQSLMVRRALFRRLGNFDISLRHRDVVEWISRVRQQGAICEIIDDVLVLRRIHDSNLSRQRDHKTGGEELFTMLKASLERRKGREDN